MQLIYPTHLTLLDVIILTEFGEDYKLWSYTLFSSLQTPIPSSADATNILTDSTEQNLL